MKEGQFFLLSKIYGVHALYWSSSSKHIWYEDARHVMLGVDVKTCLDYSCNKFYIQLVNTGIINYLELLYLECLYLERLQVCM